MLSNSGHVRTGVYHDSSRRNVKHWAYTGQPVISQARREGACDLVRIEGAIRVGDKDYGINGWIASIDLSNVDPWSELQGTGSAASSSGGPSRDPTDINDQDWWTFIICAQGLDHALGILDIPVI